MESIAWMAWTLPTAIFFASLACTLLVMTWLAAAYPEAERVGVLRIPTTRGDRLFISLITAAVIHLLWIGHGSRLRRPQHHVLTDLLGAYRLTSPSRQAGQSDRRHYCFCPHRAHTCPLSNTSIRWNRASVP